ncbi:MAG: hypothetical protein Kow0077_03440 [Anaerolineae bacterium]
MRSQAKTLSSSVTSRQLPRGLRVVLVVLVVIGLLHLWGAVRLLLFGHDYVALGLSFSPWLAALVHLGWGAGWLRILVYLWRGRNRSVRPVFYFVGAYALFHLLWWQSFAIADYARVRLPFAALVLAGGAVGLMWYSAGVAGWRQSE